jgi:hypothetical protein
MEIEAIPQVVVQVWRAIVWLASVSLLGSFFVYFPRAWWARNSDRQELDQWSLAIYAAIGLVLARAVVVQMVDWEAPLKLEGLPVTTLIIACIGYARWIRFDRDR